MTVNQEMLSRAEEILSKKNTGPSGVLAYMWANASEELPTYNRPYIDQHRLQPLKHISRFLKQIVVA